MLRFRQTLCWLLLLVLAGISFGTQWQYVRHLNLPAQFHANQRDLDAMAHARFEQLIAHLPAQEPVGYVNLFADPKASATWFMRARYVLVPARLEHRADLPWVVLDFPDDQSVLAWLARHQDYELSATSAPGAALVRRRGH